jgi:hypothetical protein
MRQVLGWLSMLGGVYIRLQATASERPGQRVETFSAGSLSTPEGQYGANCAPGERWGGGVGAMSSASPEGQGGENN